MEQLQKYLGYNPATGNFWWKRDTNSRGPSKVGRYAGVVNTYGYVVIGFFGERLYAHRIAWLFIHGYMPERIDHINSNPSDNRLCNLRECTHAQNLAAALSNVPGYEIHGTKYRARIQVNGIRYELGLYDTPEKATLAYREARVKFLGEFA